MHRQPSRETKRTASSRDDTVLTQHLKPGSEYSGDLQVRERTPTHTGMGLWPPKMQQQQCLFKTQQGGIWCCPYSPERVHRNR